MNDEMPDDAGHDLPGDPTDETVVDSAAEPGDPASSAPPAEGDAEAAPVQPSMDGRQLEAIVEALGGF